MIKEQSQKNTSNPLLNIEIPHNFKPNHEVLSRVCTIGAQIWFMNWYAHPQNDEFPNGATFLIFPRNCFKSEAIEGIEIQRWKFLGRPKDQSTNEVFWNRPKIRPTCERSVIKFYPRFYKFKRTFIEEYFRRSGIYHTYPLEKVRRELLFASSELLKLRDHSQKEESIFNNAPTEKFSS